MTSLSKLLVIAAAFLATLSHGADQPNIMVILADDLGWGDLSCYGAKDLKTPNIDKLAAGGLKFTNFRANSSVCSPTRASLLTGRYPDRVGVPGVIRTHGNNSWGHLKPSGIMLPQLLRNAGYHATIIGKWHLGLETPNTPLEHGFEYFNGFLGDMMDDYYTHLRHGENYMRLNKEASKPTGHATDLFTNWAVEYLKNPVRKEKPFFLYLAYNAPHSPVQPPEEWLKRVKEREKGIDEKRAKLVALIEHMDDGVGKIMAALETAGKKENTLIIFTSDNGGDLSSGASNGPWRDGKQSMYEGGLKVPFIAYWPGKIAAGKSDDLEAVTMDIYPTLQEVAGATKQPRTDGSSFLPALLGEKQEFNRELYFTRREGGLKYGGKTIDAVIKGEWKLLQNSPFEPMELYHLSADPKEEHDLASKERRIFNEMAIILQKNLQAGGAVPWQKPLP
jgi:arylsulfatase A-like enzyme